MIEITPQPAAMAPALMQLTDDNLAMLADYAGTYPDETLHALVGALRLSRVAERRFGERLHAEVEAYRSMNGLKGLRPITEDDQPESLVDVLIQHPDITGDYDRPEVSIGYRRPDGLYYFRNLRDFRVEPTHWMPLPEPVGWDEESDERDENEEAP